MKINKPQTVNVLHYHNQQLRVLKVTHPSLPQVRLQIINTMIFFKKRDGSGKGSRLFSPVPLNCLSVIILIFIIILHGRQNGI